MGGAVLEKPRNPSRKNRQILYYTTSLDRNILSGKLTEQWEINFVSLPTLQRIFISVNYGVRLVQGSNFIAAIAVEGEQNAVDHCGNDGNFLPYSAIFILFTVHYYFDT